MTNESFDEWHESIREATTPELQKLIAAFELHTRRSEEVGKTSRAHAYRELLEAAEAEMQARRDSYTGEIDS